MASGSRSTAWIFDAPGGGDGEPVEVAVDADETLDAESAPDPDREGTHSAADVEQRADRPVGPAGHLVEHAVEVGHGAGLGADTEIVAGRQSQRAARRIVISLSLRDGGSVEHADLVVNNF